MDGAKVAHPNAGSVQVYDLERKENVKKAETGKGFDSDTGKYRFGFVFRGRHAGQFFKGRIKSRF